jgi:hypothetical protein
MKKLLYWLAACTLLIVTVSVDVVYVKYIAGTIGGLMFGVGWIRDFQAAADEKIKESRHDNLP